MVLESLWFHWELWMRPLSSSKAYHMPIEQNSEKSQPLSEKARMEEVWIISKRILFFKTFKNTNETQREALTLESWPQNIRYVRRYPWQDLGWTYCQECSPKVRIPPMEPGVHGTQREALCHLSGRWLAFQMWEWATWSHSYGWQIGFLTIF